MEEWNQVKTIFESTSADFHGGLEIVFEKQIEAYEISHEEDVVKRFKSACAFLGLKDSTQYTLGGSDNNHFVRNGIRGIVVACGMNEVHTTKEFTTAEDLEKSAMLALRLILEKS